MEKSLKKWIIGVLIALLFFLTCIAVINAVIDPYFHYHKPIAGINYIFPDQRFGNDGIVKNFEYDAIITGSSMTENFKTSECNELFEVNAIKVPFSGGSYREINDLLTTAVSHNDSIKMVVRGLDYNRMFNTAEYRDYEEYPEYLYDEKLLNDVNYLFNLDAVTIAVQELLKRQKTVLDFDVYSNWQADYPFGKEAVDSNYARNTVVPVDKQKQVTEAEYSIIKENIEKNVIALAMENPQIEFYLYFTPYNISYIDYYKLEGNLERQLEAEKYIIELLLPIKNIHIYSFYLEHDIINDPNNYRDVAHHGENVNSLILQWIKEGKGLLTEDNYLKYCEEEREYYLNFDYDEYFKDWD